jgi:hypothetical protein
VKLATTGHRNDRSQRESFVDWRISTAMTFGGGEDGIGFDVSGLGEVGVSLISTQKCNDRGDNQGAA